MPITTARARVTDAARYQDLLPYAAQAVGADSGILTLWPAAQILGDLARHFRFPGRNPTTGTYSP